MTRPFAALARRVAPDPRGDAALLAARDDPAAFAELVARHGPLVWAVCRQLLPEADAEDAFQATFLALYRGTVRDPAALPAWLHGAALRVALAARREAARRRARERAAAAPEAAPPPDHWADTMAVVHAEVAALPAADRAAFVLCVLDGLTQAEAAARLGRTPGAVAGQVARAKARLVARLAGRGVAPALAALGTAAAAHAVPTTLLQRTADRADVSPAVRQLAKGAMSMAPTYTAAGLAAAAAAVLAAGVIGASGGQPPPAPPPPAAQPAPLPAAAPKLVRTLTGHANRVTGVAFAPEGTQLASASWDGTVRVWDARTGREVRRLGADELPDRRPQTGEPREWTFQQVEFAPDANSLAAARREPNDKFVVVQWDRAETKIRSYPAEGDCFAFSPDGKRLACGGYQTVTLYDLTDGGKLLRATPPDERNQGVSRVLFTPDGKTLLSVSHPPTPQPDPNVRRLTIMPDELRFWDAATGKEVVTKLTGTVVGHHGVGPVAFSPDGKTLATTQRKDVILRDFVTGAERAKLAGHTDDLFSLAYSPDGRTLASGGLDGTIRLWDAATGRALARLGEPVPQFGGRGWVLALSFAPDGKTLAAGTLDNTVQLWDVAVVTGR